MADKEENPMMSWIAKYDAALADKPFLGSIYDDAWRQKVRTRLLSFGNVCYLSNAFGYQAPWLEACGLIPKGWQERLEKGASILLPMMTEQEQGHLAKRMRDTESTSAEEELLLTRGFALEFGQEAIRLPQTLPDEPRPEFEVDANGHRLLVEAKGRLEGQSVVREREMRRQIELEDDIRIQDPPLLDDKVEDRIKKKIGSTLWHKVTNDTAFVLALSVYTFPPDFCAIIDIVREFALNPENPRCLRKHPGDYGLADKHWALAIALVFQGRIQGVWFNSTVRDRLGIGATTQERIRSAINGSFYPREDRIFFCERMTADEHRSAILALRSAGHMRNTSKET